MSIVLNGCTTWTLTKHIERKFGDNCTRMQWASLNKSQNQHPTKQQLHGHQPPISKTIQIRWIRHVGYCWRCKDKLLSDVLLLTLSHRWAGVERPAKLIYNNSVLTQDMAWKTCWKQWTIETNGKRELEKFMLAVWHDDDEMW